MFTITKGVGVCKTDATIQVTVLPELVASLTSSEDTICDGQGANLTVTASGGVPNTVYSYSWNQGLFPIDNNSVNPMVTTTYIVSTSDGCSDNAIDSVTIVIAENFNVSIATSAQACYGDEGYAVVSVTGNSSYDYAWNTDPVQTSDSIMGNAGDSYQVTITDINSGCDYDTLIKIPSYSIIYAGFSISPNLECVSFDQIDRITIIDLSKNAESGFNAK